MGRRGVVIGQSLVIIFTIIVLVVLSLIFSKAFGIFNKAGKDKDVLDFSNELGEKFKLIRSMGYNSRIKVRLKAIAPEICFVDMDYKDDVKEKVPNEIQPYVNATGQKDNVYLIGRDEMFFVGNISVDRDGDENPDTKNNAYLCINSSTFFQFYLTNKGNSVMISVG